MRRERRKAVKERERKQGQHWEIYERSESVKEGEKQKGIGKRRNN